MNQISEENEMLIEEKTDDFRSSAVFHDQFRESLTLVNEQIRELCENKANERIQVWINGERSERHFLLVKKNPIKIGESVEQWTHRVFGDEKFGMIFNDIHKFSLNLCRSLLTFLKPIIEKSGVPSGGYDTALFVGNYGMTPLGIHKDLNGGKVLTFHFGPGKKSIYQWNDDSYEKLTGFKGNYKPESDEFLKTADQVYAFEAGDLFFMPENIWHIGTSYEFSMSLTFWFNHYDQQTLYKKNILKYLENVLQNKNELLHPYKIKPGEDLALNEDIFNLHQKKEHANLQTEKLFKILYRDYQFEMMSNGGFMSPPDLLDQNEKELLITKRVRGVQPFQIFYRSEKELLKLYVRGRQIEIPYSDAVVIAIDKLNSYEVYELSELLLPMTETWDDDVAIHVLNLIYNHNGIEIID